MRSMIRNEIKNHHHHHSLLLLLGTQAKAVSEHSFEACSFGCEQERHFEGVSEDKGSPGQLGVPGPQELGLF